MPDASTEDRDRTYGVRTRVCSQALEFGLTSLARATDTGDESAQFAGLIADLVRMHGLTADQARHCATAAMIFTSGARSQRAILERR